MLRKRHIYDIVKLSKKVVIYMDMGNQKIKSLREEKGMTLEELGKYCWCW